MRQKPLVVARRKVGSLMGPAGLRAVQRTLHDRLRDVQHVAQFERRNQLRVEGSAVVIKRNVLIPLLQFVKLLNRLLERRLQAINPGSALDRLLHLFAQSRDTFPATSLEEILFFQSRQLIGSLRQYAAIRLFLPGSKFSRRPPRSRAKNQALGE